MNILVTLDSNYIPHLAVMLRSLMFSNPGTRFDIFVAHSSLNAEDFRVIQRNIDASRTVVHPIRVSDRLFTDAPILKRTSRETYFRLLLTEYLPEDVDRILYIDPDTVVINPLDELYNVRFGDDLLAAAGHTKGFVELINHLRLHMGRHSRYINAGIMMINVEKMRAEISAADIFAYIRKNARRLYLADQDVINGMFARRTLLVDPCVYNLDEKTVRFRHIDPDSGWIDKNTVIVHFNGSQKPWKEAYKGVLADYYFRFKNMNPGFLEPTKKEKDHKGKTA